MAITRTPIVDDDGTGTTGTVIDNAWKTELYNQIDGIGGVTTWTPVWRSDATQPAIGNGTLAGYYTDSNGHVTFTITLTFGSTTAPGTGVWKFSIPVQPRAGASLIWGTGQALGPPYVPLYCLQIAQPPSVEVQPVFYLGGAGTSETACSPTQPFTWAAGMTLALSGSFFR